MSNTRDEKKSCNNKIIFESDISRKVISNYDIKNDKDARLYTLFLVISKVNSDRDSLNERKNFDLNVYYLRLRFRWI